MRPSTLVIALMSVKSARINLEAANDGLRDDIRRLGGVMRAYRKRAGLSIKQLASRAGISSSYLGMMETGDREFTERWCRVVINEIKKYARSKRSKR